MPTAISNAPANFVDLPLGTLPPRKGRVANAAARLEFPLLPGNREVLLTLDAIAQLEENWDGYQAAAPAPEAVNQAREFVQNLNSLRQAAHFASPGPNGNVLVELKAGVRTISFHFFPQRPLRYVCFEGRNFVKQGEFQPVELRNLTDWLNTNPN